VKRICFITILIALTATVFARRISWPINQKPRISINSAVETATKELNKNGGSYYCVSAEVWITFTNCDWELDFTNTAGERRIVSVGSDLSVTVSKHGFIY